MTDSVVETEPQTTSPSNPLPTQKVKKKEKKARRHMKLPAES